MNSVIYNVNFLFTPDLKEVLMINKNRGPYSGTLNGVGGKYEEEKDLLGNTMLTNMKFSSIREVREETGHEIPFWQLYWLVTETFPNGLLPPWGNGTYIDLWVFCAIVEKDNIKQQEDEILEWVSVDNLMNIYSNDLRFAGSGNIPYFINLAINYLKTNIFIKSIEC